MTAQSKVEAVKIFLGVLGNDVLKIDLSDVDPRRLARGEWREVVYVGLLLIQVATQVGLLEPEALDIIDLDPDATTSQIGSEVPTGLPPLPRKLRTPSPPPPTDPPVKRSSARVVHAPVHSTPRKRYYSGEKHTPRPPEKESTPPSTTRKPSYMTYRPVSSPPKLTYHNPAELSTCSCTFQDDMTTSTVHCHCEIHGTDDEHSTFDTSIDFRWKDTSQLPVDILAVSTLCET